MANRPHPYRREDQIAMAMAADPDFQAACDRGYRDGMAELAAERAEIIRLAEESPEQRDWESDEEDGPEQAG